MTDRSGESRHFVVNDLNYCVDEDQRKRETRAEEESRKSTLPCNISVIRNVFIGKLELPATTEDTVLSSSYSLGSVNININPNQDREGRGCGFRVSGGRDKNPFAILFQGQRNSYNRGNRERTSSSTMYNLIVFSTITDTHPRRRRPVIQIYFRS